SYNSRRGVNVSQYLRDLKVQEPAVEETFITDEDLHKELALFTNTQFFDFETGQNTDLQAPPVKPETTQPVASDVTTTDPIIGDFSTDFDFISDAPDIARPTADHGTMSPGDFNFGDFSTYTSPTVPAFPDALGNLPPIQPGPQMAAYPPVPPHHHQPGYVSSAAVPPRTAAAAAGAAGEKRKAEQQLSPLSGRVLSIDEQARLAAEEDKRKRNTAASARFRIKKKQREQALERSAKEMTEKVTMLEGRISALETENKWLKSLVTEKHGAKDEILEKLLKE
ncbi:hypothetical protein N656DRAFT_688550, partial [Canariomyces notabilis]